MNLLGGVIQIKGITYLLFCVFIIMAVGYLIGRIKIKGIDLGTAGVFIAALLFGCFFFGDLDAEMTSLGDSTRDLLKLVENIGLILFVTSVGFIAGPEFFVNLKHHFKSYAAIGAIIILSGGVAAIVCIMISRAMGEPDTDATTAMVVGLFSGALTSTPAFSAAKSAVDPAYEDLVSVGYGTAYIFGVVGVVLFVQLVPRIRKIDLKEEVKRMAAVDAKKKDHAIDTFIHIDPFGCAPFAMAAVLGILLGMIRIPLTSEGLSGECFSLTTTGGCLIMALIFGHFGHAGKISLMPYESSLKVFREFGLALFLIGAGVTGGASFVQYFQFRYFLYGVLITCVSMGVGYLFASKVLKLDIVNSLSSVTGGMTSTPALGTLIDVAGSENVAAAYAATYPVALIGVVLVTEILIILF